MLRLHVWPLEIEASRLKRSSPWTSYIRRRISLGGGTGELAEGLANPGQPCDVPGRIAVPEESSRALLAVVTEPSSATVLPDKGG